jgi:hypothetical protein
MAIKKVKVLPKDLKQNDTFLHDDEPVWAAIEDAYLAEDDTVVLCKVRFVDGGSSLRKWSIFEEREIEVARLDA